MSVSSANGCASVESSEIQEDVCSEVKSEVTCKSSSEAGDNDSGDEVPEPTDSASIHEIRCGLLTAKLHMQRFTCPGIHRRCVEFEDKLISPRQFTIKAEKDKQKDWKGSIRLGRYNLRTLMEMKTLDFYEHATNCSLKCQSRNYIKNRKNEANNDGSSTVSFIDGSDTTQPNGSAPASGFESSGDENSLRACSTRKSSSVLEDYASQTVGSMNESATLAKMGLCFQASGAESSIDPVKVEQFEVDGGYDANSTSTQKCTPKQLNQSQLPVIVATPAQHTTPVSATVAAASAITTSNPSTAFSATNQHNVNAHFAPIVTTITNPTTATESLRQLFAVQQQKMTPSTTYSNTHVANIPNPLVNGKSPLRGPGDNAIATAVGQEATLVLLLQSLVEQQQKLHNHHQPLQNPQQNNPAAAFLNSLSALGSLNGGNGVVVPGFGKLPQANTLVNGNGKQFATQQQFSHQEPVAKSTMDNGDANGVRKVLEANPVFFWSKMRAMGLLEDMLNLLSTTVDQLKQIYLHGNANTEEFAAQKLSSLALTLDLANVYGDKIHNRYVQSALESSLLAKELQELHRKTREQERKLENAKRKSQVFDQILLKNGGTANTASVDGTPELKKLHLNLGI